MSNVFTLDSLREETRKKFAPVKIGMSDGSEVELASILKLGKTSRDSVVETLKEVNDLDDDDDTPENLELIVEAISKIFSVIADKPQKLLRELDDEDPMVKLHLMSKVLGVWAKETQLGEASTSSN